MGEKPIRWVGTALDELRRFPDEARQRAGYQLALVQSGLLPDDWKPMPSVGPGVCEIRIRTRQAHRVLYTARYQEAIYVLHAFKKRTQKIRLVDIELARTRLGMITRLRGGESRA